MCFILQLRNMIRFGSQGYTFDCGLHPELTRTKLLQDKTEHQIFKNELETLVRVSKP